MYVSERIHPGTRCRTEKFGSVVTHLLFFASIYALTACKPVLNGPIDQIQPGASATPVSSTSTDPTLDETSEEGETDSQAIVAATKLSFTTQPANTSRGEQIPAFVVLVTDDAGSVATDYDGPVVLALDSNPGAATLSGTLSVAAFAGIATFTGISLDQSGTGYTFVATAAGLTSVTSNSFDVALSAPAIAFNSPSTSPANDSTPTFTVSLEGGAAFSPTDTIEIYDQAACAGTAVGSTIGVSATTASITVSAQAEGSTTYSAKITELSGASSCSSAHGTVASRTKTFVHDGTSPAAPSIVLDDPSTSPSADSTPRFEIALTGGGNFDPSDVITLHEGADCSGASVGSITNQSGATVALTRSSAMSAGTVSFRAKVTDAAGNSTCSTAHATAGLRVSSYEYSTVGGITASNADTATVNERVTGNTKTLAVSVNGVASYPSTSAIDGEFSSISVHTHHSCAITTGGVLKCWGYNSASQLGDGTWTDRSVPVTVGTGFSSVATGAHRTCALKSNGDLYCWGQPPTGDPALDGFGGAGTPTRIGSSTYASLSMGDLHSCAIKTNGDLECWGYNTFGKLGDGSTTDRLSPVPIGTGFASVSAGTDHTCAIKSAGGDLYCWGYNAFGQIGDGSTSDSSIPVLVGSGYASVATGTNMTCAIKTGGDLECWGYNGNGSVGDGTTTNRLIPVSIGSGYSSVSADYEHTCAVTTTGNLECWGQNTDGKLGDGTTTARLSPVDVGSAGDFASADPGTAHSCALTTGGKVLCWGYNVLGNLGDGLTASLNSVPSIPNYGTCTIDGVSGDVTAATCSCDGSDCTMVYHTGAYAAGTGAIDYTVRDGSGFFSDSGKLTVTVNQIPSSITASNSDTATVLENQTGLTKILDVDVNGPLAIFPNTSTSGSCTIDMVSGDLNNVSCSCDGTTCTMTYDVALATPGLDQIEYTVVDGSGGYSSSDGVLTVTVLSGSITGGNDTDTQNENTAGIQVLLNVNQMGDATFPNVGVDSGACTVDSVSGDLANASCTCDGTTCTMTYDTTASSTGMGQIDYTVTDGTGNFTGPGVLTVTVNAGGGGGALIADDTQNGGSFMQNTPSAQIGLNISTVGGALMPNTSGTGVCSVSNATGDMSNPICTCDGSSCIVTFDTTPFSSGSASFDYFVQDDTGAYNDSGSVMFTVTP